ncbi:MAG: glycosyltransferase family 2 protein [Arcicella sp.]|jgi:glycosyltransferase involved in cell wall biosynthesis|nr:glycosyltransferase family 2 protein [Arcicella sp.]
MFSENPLVSIVALCYNHEKYVIEALQSVVNQTYPNIELIIVDDFSTDGSREKISTFVKNHPSVQVIFNEKNIGNCKAFNRAFKISKGKYLIDLSTDDVMLPNRVEEQVKLFESSDKIGVVFADADFIDEESNFLKNIKDSYQLEPPIGDVYESILRGKAYVMPCSMMMRRSLLEQLGGYDETLSYEDLDFWIRSARICEFGYVPQILAQQRVLRGSHSTKSIMKNSILIQSSVKICQKAYLLNKTEKEHEALAVRLRMDLLRCALTENYQAGEQALQLMKKLNKHNWKSRVAQFIIFFKIPINFLYVSVMTLRRLINFKTRY